jgi:hypothetical protein
MTVKTLPQGEQYRQHEGNRKLGYIPTAQRTIININQLKGSEKRKMREKGLL